MKILISGSSGLIGSALIKRLADSGHQITRLVRDERAAGNAAIFWDPYARKLDPEKIEGFDALLHLAGRNIGAGRWSAAARKEIVESRTGPTRFLAETISGLANRPKLFLSSSAIGYYGDRKDEILTEESGPGEGFLPELCVEWEKACDPARRSEIRTVNLRIAIVLASTGGALPRMAAPFRFGAGGKLGNGEQFMSWVTLDDLVSVFEFALGATSVSGPINVVSPNAVTNAEFTKRLAQAVHRPALFRVPGFAIKLMLGEMGEALLLSSARVVPAKLTRAGFTFSDSDLLTALQRLLSK